MNEWVIEEAVNATVVALGPYTVLVERVSFPGAVVLTFTATGRVLVNGVDSDLGDDLPCYLGIGDAVADEPLGAWVALPAE